MYEKEDIDPSEAHSTYIFSDLCHIGDGRYKVLKGPRENADTIKKNVC
jgi:hypothetical protein